MNIFWITFESTFVAILRIALVCIGAGLLVRKNIITRSHIESLSTVMIRVLLPCLIFSKIISAFNPKTFPIVDTSVDCMWDGTDRAFGSLVSIQT